jgi:hypothetical protein
MDKLEAVRIAARNLDLAGDEELLARTAEDKAKARQKMIAAEREYARALDAFDECDAENSV